jgi:hypothetical protein
MEVAEMQDLGQRYNARFGNLDEIGLPEILADKRFLALMEEALRSGQPVTRSSIDAAIPDVAWEE